MARPLARSSPDPTFAPRKAERTRDGLTWVNVRGEGVRSLDHDGAGSVESRSVLVLILVTSAKNG